MYSSQRTRSPHHSCQSCVPSASSVPPGSPSSALPQAPVAPHQATPPPPTEITTSCQKLSKSPLYVEVWGTFRQPNCQLSGNKGGWGMIQVVNLCLCRCVSTWISGLVTSSVMHLASSLDSKATAFSLSCTSQPLICGSKTREDGHVFGCQELDNRTCRSSSIYP